MATVNWLSAPESTQFYTKTYTPAEPKAVIVFLHGFAEHIDRFIHFHPRYLEHNIALFTFDQRGFGRTALDADHKSKKSSYAVTSWNEQMNDIAWAISQAKENFPGLPIFLMGHSMGGGEVLGFATRGNKSPHYATITSLAGILATSPLIKQAKPTGKLTRWAGGQVAGLIPNLIIPAPVDPDALSHDHTVGAAYLKDPLVKLEGTLRQLSEMLSNGESLLSKNWKNWPKDLPLFMAHGTGDKVTCPTASQEFFDKVDATNKKIKLFEGGFHELHNEPSPIPDELLSEVVAFINAHLPAKKDTPPEPKL